MAEHAQTVTDVALEADLLADRRRFWGSWTRAVMGAGIAIALLLIAMRIFLV